MNRRDADALIYKLEEFGGLVKWHDYRLNITEVRGKLRFAFIPISDQARTVFTALGMRMDANPSE